MTRTNHGLAEWLTARFHVASLAIYSKSSPSWELPCEGLVDADDLEKQGGLIEKKEHMIIEDQMKLDDV